MTEGWTCSRCSTENAASRFGCSNCGLLRHDASIAGSTAGAGSPDPLTEDLTADRTVEVAQPTASVGGAAEDPIWSEPVAAWGPADDDDGEVASPSLPIWRRLPVGWLLVAALIGGGAVAGWYFNASRSSSGEITKTGDMTAVDLRVGDCFDLKNPTADEVEDVTAGPCTSAHEFEMFYVGSMPAGDFPADAVFETYVTDNCYPAFGTYIGKAYDDSELEMYWLAPTESAWRAGDRSVQCAAYHPLVDSQTVSLKGSNQ